VRWSTAKELLVQTDGRLRELADHGEVDMNDADVLAAFIHRSVRVRLPSASVRRLREMAICSSFGRPI
jgi:hypothetical protein